DPFSQCPVQHRRRAGRGSQLRPPDQPEARLVDLSRWYQLRSVVHQRRMGAVPWSGRCSDCWWCVMASDFVTTNTFVPLGASSAVTGRSTAPNSLSIDTSMTTAQIFSTLVKNQAYARLD